VAGHVEGVSVKQLGLGLGLLLILAACGGADGGNGDLNADTAVGDTAVSATVSSPDGKAVLTLSAGSLPDGVTADNLQIDWAEGISDEPGAPVVAVRLAPDGLVLNEGASLRIELPDSVGDDLMVAHVTAGGFSFIGGSIEEADGIRFFTTSVDHFSTVVISDVPGVTTLIARASPDTVTVDQTQQVTAEVWFEPIPITVLIPTGHGIEQTRLYTFDNVRPLGNPSLHKGIISWRGTQWEPNWRRPVVTVDDVIVTFAGSSVCRAVNSIDPDFWFSVEVEMELATEGSVIDEPLFQFSRALGLEYTRSYDSRDVPVSAAVGDTFEARVMVNGTVASECVKSGTSDTTAGSESPSTTEGPERSVLSDDHKDCVIDNIEDNGGGVYIVTFVGDCQAASSGYHDFRVRIETTDEEWRTSSDSGHRELCNYRAVGDEVIVRCDGFNRADSVGGSIDGVRFSAEAEFTAGNEMMFTTDSAVTNGNLSGRVSITASDGSKEESQSFPP
jgi:hypothetical protein